MVPARRLRLRVIPLASVLAAVIAAAGCGITTTVDADVKSPDGKYEAAVLRTDAGAMTSDIIGVTVYLQPRHDAWLFSSPNETVFEFHSGAVDVQWEDSRRLRLRCSGVSGVSVALDQWDDIAVLRDGCPSPSR